ncbi:MAG TPA: PHP domain-containing protein [Candidatus Scybalocola faecavium]|nr:PHP domain-containing protein [Candidatus Scybalocola faecavium]
MLSLSYDLHIHSCLSPCGDEDMTPANIAGLAALIGLDVIAVTDHNSCKNCPGVIEAARAYDLTVIPGMELTTREEVHVVCLFETLKDAMAFDAYVEGQLIPFPNNEEIFGRQCICASDDTVIGTYPHLLINATNISFDNVYELTAAYHGIMIPAHIDKDSTSLLSNLGFIPPDSRFTCVEIKNMENLPQLIRQHPYLEKCRIITNSDAHYLEHMNEAIHRIHSKSRRIPDILKSLTSR